MVSSLAALQAATEGFTGADLKRLVEDGKAIYAYDKAKQFDLKTPTDYFLKAVEGVRENKQRFAEAEAQTALKPKGPMAGFSSFVLSKVIEQGREEEPLVIALDPSRLEDGVVGEHQPDLGGLADPQEIPQARGRVAGHRRMVRRGAGVSPMRSPALAVRGASPASHRDVRCARPARRAEREYRLCLTEAQRRRAGAPAARLVRGGVGMGCSVRRMQRELHHGLLGW